MIVLDDIPSRIFDLLPYYYENYKNRSCLFAACKAGKWIEYDGKLFCRLTDSLSLELLRRGLHKGDKVALIATNSPQWNMIDFAVMQIGAILVPIYPNISVIEFDYILDHSEAKAIFLDNPKTYNRYKESIVRHIDDHHVCFINGKREEHLVLDDLIQETVEDLTQKALLEETKKSISPQEIATIIYTSGTSGTPKGVMLSHENIMENIKYYGAQYPVTKVAVSYLPLSHVFERSAQYTRIYYGVSTYYVENTGTIMRDIANVKPEHFSTIPRVIEKIHNGILQNGNQLKGLKKRVFFWAINLAYQYDETERKNSWLYMKKIALANLLVFNKVKQVFGGNLKFIISGGAPVQPRLIKLFAAMHCPIIEGYGLTETSPVISTNSQVTGKIKAGTVGIPCSNLDVRIDGATSEILVKGPSVMKAYYKDENLTHFAFTDEGYFHTGDKGYFDEDGFLKITGRLKEIFKNSMGKYISPAIMENKLCESPWFNNVIVVGEYQKFAAALIVPNFEQIKQWCKETGIPYTTDTEMAKDNKVNVRVRQEVEKCNKSFNCFEQIKRFILLDHEWTVESGELTPSLKIRRSVIMEKYKESIDALFD